MLGMNLRTYIKTHSISQRDIARVAGVTEGRVSQWMSLERGFPAERAKSVHDALGVPLHLMRCDLWEPPVTVAGDAT